VIVLSQFGIANPGGEPLSNHVFSIRELLEKADESELNSVKSISEKTITYFKEFNEEQGKGLGFYVSGIDKENGIVIPCVHLIRFYKKNDGTHEIENKQIRKISTIKDYGLSWAGEGSWIISKLLRLSDQKSGIPAAAISFHLLLLKDGVELTEYLINSVIDFEKF